MCPQLVMATHGRGGLTRLRLGSVAAKVVQSTERPVLLVQAGVEPAALPAPED
jgi:nucleotide-binding universal stress UspA family protein